MSLYRSGQAASVLCRQNLRLRMTTTVANCWHIMRATLASGTKLGPYEIQSPLGAGGRGEVYRARDTRLDCTLADYNAPRFSPDGKSIAVTLRDPKSGSTNIWIYPTAGGQ